MIPRDARSLTILLPAILCFCTLPATGRAAQTDATLVIPERPLSLPQAGVPFSDPDFGLPTVRIAGARPEYAELQAWNADQTLILLNTLEVRDAATYRVVHNIDYGWPDTGTALRWSPVDPLVLYYVDNNDSFCSGGVLLKYTLIPGNPMTRKREAVHCFPEYTKLLKNESFEEMSDDGRYLGLVGSKTASNQWGWLAEAFVFDVQNNVKHRPLELPVDPTWGPRASDHCSMVPSGKYALLFWGEGTDRWRGTEAFDLEMNYVGKVHTGNTPHCALVMDANGDDWMVSDNASNGYLLSGKHYIVKSRIPVGCYIDSSGNLDVQKTLSTGATAPLLSLDWYLNMHLSGTNSLAHGWVVVGTYNTDAGYQNGVQPFENELFKLYLDSTDARPHVERLAHHRSVPYAITGRDACANTDYWAQPHATVSRDGSKLIFGSNWGQICQSPDPIDAYVITLGESTVIPAPPPPAPPTPPGPGPGTDALNVPLNTWVSVRPTFTLPAGKTGQFDERGYTKMVFAPSIGKFISYDGYMDNSGYPYSIYSNCIWSYDARTNLMKAEKLSNWHVTTPGNGYLTQALVANSSDPTPPDRHQYGVMAFVPEKNAVYIWGGANQTLPGGHPVDTWAFQLGSMVWASQNPPAHPESMLEIAAAYDTDAKRMVMFGGSQGPGGRTFLYDPAANRWGELNVSGARPPWLMGHSMVYDPVRKRTLLFGGGPWPNALNGLWSFDLARVAWTEITPANSPPPRKSCGFAYDLRHDVFLLAGGSNGEDGIQYNDTWLFHPVSGQWEQVHPAISPTGYSRYVDLDYDPLNNVFFAHYGANFWLYRISNDAGVDKVPPATPVNLRVR